MSLIQREPVAMAAGLDGLVKATIAVLIGFEVVSWTAEQVALVISLETALIGFIMVLVRGVVTPVASIAALVAPFEPFDPPAEILNHEHGGNQ